MVVLGLLLCRRVHCLLALSQHMRLSSGKPLRWSSLELDSATCSILCGGLELCFARIAESGAHAEEVLSRRRTFHGRSKTEECVVFDGALPQMFACFFIVQTEDKSVLHLFAIVVVLNDYQRQFLFLKVQFSDLWPEEEANLGDSFKHQNASRRQTQVVLAAVLAQHCVHINAVHVKPFSFV